jgi:hypothetical protein
VEKEREEGSKKDKHETDAEQKNKRTKHLK